MLGRTRRDDAAAFMDEWAPDLADLLHDAWPMLRYVGPRVINDCPGLLLTAPRNEQARFSVPLNAFFSVTPRGLHAFFRDDLMAYAFFNANLRWLDRYCEQYDVDLPGGSQSTALTSTVIIDPLFSPSQV